MADIVGRAALGAIVGGIVVGGAARILHGPVRQALTGVLAGVIGGAVVGGAVSGIGDSQALTVGIASGAAAAAAAAGVLPGLHGMPVSPRAIGFEVAIIGMLGGTAVGGVIDWLER